MAHNSELRTSEDVDVLMVDPFLDYINNILTEEGMDDASFSQQVDNASYQAIFSGFQDILGESLTPTAYGDFGSHEEVCVPHGLHQRVFCFPENGSGEKVASANIELIDEFHNIGGIPRVSLPVNGHPQRCSSKQGIALNSKTSLSSSKDTATESRYRWNDRVIMDAMVSSDRDNMAQNLHNSNVGLRREQGNGKVKPPSSGEEFPSELAELDLSFEDLNLDDVYNSLYVEEPHSTIVPARNGKHNGDKQNLLQAKGRKFHEKRRSKDPVFVDVREVLISCAQAVAIGDAGRASKILQEVCQVHGASANGTSLQRLAHYFSKALATRMRGIGHHEVEAMAPDMPSAATVLRASKVGFEVSPYEKVLHYLANQSILRAAEGASKLHILDYGLMYGMQWPCLINALADRKGGPPLLVITGIDFPQPGVNVVERLDRSGQRLAAYAKTYNVPFLYHAIVTNKWEDLDAASLYCSESEVLVVNCVRSLRHIPDDSADLVSSSSPRQKLLTCMHSLKPHLLVTAVVNAPLNSPFFVTRFREALYFYSNLFDMLDTLWDDIPVRLLAEGSCSYSNIVNMVACEGAERVERPETYKQWHARITKAGFEQLPIPSTILSRSKSHVKQHYHKDFLIHDDGKGWMLMGWKGRITLAISAWKLCPV